MSLEHADERTYAINDLTFVPLADFQHVCLKSGCLVDASHIAIKPSADYATYPHKDGDQAFELVALRCLECVDEGGASQ